MGRKKLGMMGGTGLALLATAAGYAQAASQPGCDRACLLGVLNRYEADVLQHDPAGLRTTDDFRATDNYRPIKLGDGYWQNISTIYYQLRFADPVTGEVAAVGMLNQGGRDGYYSLRLKVRDHRISQSEMFVVKKGEATFFEEDRNRRISPVYEAVVPPAHRSSRAELLKITDSFNDSWQYRNEDLTRYAPDCDFYENNVKLNTPDGPAGPTCGGMVEYGGKNGVEGAGKAGNNQGRRPPGVPANAGGSPTDGPPRTLRPADPTIGRPKLFGTQMWMRDRRYPIVDVKRGVVFGYVIQGGEPARPGQPVIYDVPPGSPFSGSGPAAGRAAVAGGAGAAGEAGAAGAPGGGGPPRNAGAPPPGGTESFAAYMFFLCKIVNGQIVRIDHFERSGGPNASGGFADGPSH